MFGVGVVVGAQYDPPSCEQTAQVLEVDRVVDLQTGCPSACWVMVLVLVFGVGGWRCSVRPARRLLSG